MTPKEKAIELVEKMSMPDNIYQGQQLAKQCALIAVNEVISHAKNISMVYDLTFDESTNYWQEVKIEIEKL